MRKGRLTGVGKTALGMAVVRAAESHRDDRLFDDPYAAAFVAADPDAFTGSGVPATPLTCDFVQGAIIRTRFFDDYLSASGCRQVVLLAAGLDTRALRLHWPAGTRVFEVDLPGVLAFKEEVLAGAAARCERIVVPADLRRDWAAELTERGFDRNRPTAWLVEGLLIYLSKEDATRLLVTVGEVSARGSRMAFEHGTAASASLLSQARRTPGMAEYISMWRGGLRGETVDWLAERGWRVQVHDRSALAAAYGRPGDGCGSLVIAQLINP